MNYVPLQIKTSYSLLNSLNNIEQLVSKAVILGYTSLAITDNNMFGVMEFYKCCNKNNIKPIIGLEVSICNGIILLYAKNNLGYQHLIKLATIASERKITEEDLNDKNNVILVMPFSFYNEDIYNSYSIKYIGYQNSEQRKLIEYPCVYINDVSYINKLDYKYLDYLHMIKEGKVLGEYELNTHQNKHLLSFEEINTLSSEEDIANAKAISEMCNVNITYQSGLLPIFNSKINELEQLTNLCYKGLNKRLNNNIDKIYQNRLEYELSIIDKMGFCNYFLIVYDYVKYAKKNNILVGPGRGSAAGSLVSYTLGIIDIDPIKYNLLFERFLNPERITMPDIDIDFDSVKRDQVVKYVVDKYGQKKVAGIITFNTLASKQVIKDVGRVLELSPRLIEVISKLITEKTLILSYKNNTKLKSLVNNSTELKKLFDIATHLEGLPRHASIHASGIVIANKDLDEIIPLYKSDAGIYITAYSMNYLEELGLLKMDFLGISNLTIIDEVINDIRKNENINITFQNIPLDNQSTLDIFYQVDTDGIFQFESQGMKNFLKKLKPTSINDLIAAIALFRPGPMENIDTYIKRKEGKEKIEYIDPSLEPILKSTYGIIIYQEQIMQIANILSGYSLGEADILRSAMSKKKEDILIKEKDKFINRAIQNNHSKETATKVYNLILKFANYGFNLSHSVSYVIVAYKMAFLKKHFFKYFQTGLLNNCIGSEYKTKQYIYEARNKEIKIIPPDINISTSKYIVEKNNIICPFSIIKNIGVTITNKIEEERKKGQFSDFIDFVIRTYSSTINKKIIISLIHAGVFNSFKLNKKTLIENLDNIINYAELINDMNLFEIEKPNILIYDEYSKDELNNLELDSFNFYLSLHPTSKYRNINDYTTNDIENNFNKRITLILHVENIKEIVTKKNDVMAFINASDEYKTVSLILFPNVYENNKNISTNNIIECSGRVEKRYDEYQIIVDNIKVIN